jgi:putative transposase
MPRLEATQIDLSESESQELAQILRRTSTPQQVALRAKIILRAASGSSNGKIAQELGISVEY